jgi:hypothetical protein
MEVRGSASGSCASEGGTNGSFKNGAARETKTRASDFGIGFVFAILHCASCAVPGELRSELCSDGPSKQYYAAVGGVMAVGWRKWLWRVGEYCCTQCQHYRAVRLAGFDAAAQIFEDFLLSLLYFKQDGSQIRNALLSE